jgi:glycolate oxidase FAD binding subunit
MQPGAHVRPASVAELVALIDDARAGGTRLDLRGGGSKAGFGAPVDVAPVDSAVVVDMRGFAGIVDYDPAELVLTVRSGTPLGEVEDLLAAHGQMLAFDPFDHGPIHRRPAGDATIGGVFAAGVAGSRRLARGGARDHLLGFKAVSGRGEAFVAGARVTKNVTGFDLPKLACGSWGRLFALTELHVKTLPRAQMGVTVALDGLTVDAAVAAMSRAAGSQATICAAAHDPQAGLTVLRIEGFAPSVMVRQALLGEILRDWGPLRMLDAKAADAVWDSLRGLTGLADAPVLWRVVVPARQSPALIAALGAPGLRWLMDWAGGLVWIGCDDAIGAVRAVAEAVGGHADLVRADAQSRRQYPARHPRAPALAALEARVRRAFDPAGVFETGRFGDT